MNITRRRGKQKSKVYSELVLLYIIILSMIEKRGDDTSCVCVGTSTTLRDCRSVNTPHWSPPPPLLQVGGNNSAGVTGGEKHLR